MLGSKVAADGPHSLSFRQPRPPSPFSTLRIDVQSFYDAFVIFPFSFAFFSAFYLNIFFRSIFI
ncbi:hypothetical protein M5D96_005726 [Drosophila gunungcola]|uniref:Transmembrane protein n=1 Tax=Drosophila gunungcola TaxID=103775 RepID=A0A9P9YR01_9MUSC|nr:hypothetical protein M5D96_005726 [Drosophila gunungcola]